MVSRGPADPSPPLTKVRQPGPDPAGPALTRPRIWVNPQGFPQFLRQNPKYSANPEVFTQILKDSLAIRWDLVDGGGPSRPENNKSIWIIN